MRRSPLAITLATLVVLGCSFRAADRSRAQKVSRRPHPYASTKPLKQPAIFAEHVLCTGDFESHPAFTPDGRTPSPENKSLESSGVRA
jgi:hypothetical protein